MPTRYRIQPEGYASHIPEVQSGGLLAGPKLLVNGQPAPSKPGLPRGQYELRRDDGREVTTSWRPQMLGLDTPQLVLDGKTLALVEPLKWFQWLWSAWPVALGLDK
jgi:hypothetical protein